MRSGQSSVEYIIILVVIIILALAILMNLPALTSLFKFTAVTEARLNDIHNILNDVALKTTISSTGYTQASAMTFKYASVSDFRLTITSESGQNCTIIIGTVSGDWITNSTNCPFLNGATGDLYDFRCTLSYTDPQININYSKAGVCKGIYEEA